jgi:hypothetical protein
VVVFVSILDDFVFDSFLSVPSKHGELDTFQATSPYYISHGFDYESNQASHYIPNGFDDESYEHAVKMYRLAQLF